MYCILVNSSKKHHQAFFQFLLDNKRDNIDIISYDDINHIDWKSLNKYEYVIILSRYSYININKVIDFCTTKQPSFSALSTYWGVGLPYMAILSKETISKLISAHGGYGKYFVDATENLFFNIFMMSIKLPSIRSVLFLSDDELSDICEEHKVVSLNSASYINNIEHIKGQFHEALFVSFNDEDDKFMDFVHEYHSGKKHIIFQNHHYVLTIGKQFFVIKQYHICLLDYQTIVYWDRNSASWKLASNDLKKELSPHLQKFLQPQLDPKPSSRYYTSIKEQGK